MDQNTIILLSVFGGVVLLLVVAGGIFAWRALGSASKRRFNPRQEIVLQQSQQPQQFNGYGCPCPPNQGPQCVPALDGTAVKPPVAIYGVGGGSNCCGGDAGINQAQLQNLVNTINADKAATETRKLFEQLAALAAKQTA